MSEIGDQPPAKPARRRARKKAQTPARAYGRSLSDFEPLLPAEKILLEATARGEVAVIGEKRPEEATEENTVRGGFLRFLLLGGDERIAAHEQADGVYGAWITGILDLQNSTIVSALDCRACTFSQPRILRRSKLPHGLFLQSSLVPGLDCEGASIKGNVFLRSGFKSIGTVRMSGVTIDGDLDCDSSHLDGLGNYAFLADGAVISGNVFLRNHFNAIGTVRLAGARIDGNLECD